MEKTHTPVAKNVTARPNIMLFAVMFYYFIIARYFVQPYLLAPLFNFFGFYPLLGWAGILNAFFRDLGIPVLLYLLYALSIKQDIRFSFSLSRLSLTNLLYIAVMTLTVRVIFNLIEIGVPFILGSGSVPMQTFRFMDVGRSLLHNAVLATIFEEAVFRGFLWTEYHRQGVRYWKIAFVTGLFFGVIHLGTFTIIHTTFAGIFFYAPLIYFTRSIWAPVLHHALMNGLYTLISPAFYIDNQVDFDAFIPTYLILLALAAAVLIPVSIVFGKKFYYENRHNVQAKKEIPKESRAFHVSYWILIVVMIATFLRA